MTTVHPLYWDLMKSVAEGLNVHLADIQEALGERPLLVTAGPPPHPLKFELMVEKPYPIRLKREGRIFDLSGPSNRNKSTALVYWGTLTGVDWDEVESFLDSPNLIRKAREAVKAIQSGQETYLRMVNHQYEFTVKTSDCRATVELKDLRTGAFVDDLDGSTIPLRHETDWARFRPMVRQACDVQLVGKGRNFVKQVGLEEGLALAGYAGEVLKRIGNIREAVLGQDVPTFTEDELRSSVATELNVIAQYQRRMDEVRNERAIHSQKARDLSSLAEQVMQVHDSSQAQSYLNLRAQLEYGRTQNTKLGVLNAEVAELKHNVAEVEQLVREGKAALESVEQACMNLAREVAQTSRGFTVLLDSGSNLVSLSRELDIDGVMSLALPIVALNNDSATVYPALVRRERSGNLSDGTPIYPLNLGSTSAHTVGDLHKSFDSEATKIQEALAIKPHLDVFIAHLQRGEIKTSTDLEEWRENYESTVGGLRGKKTELHTKTTERDMVQRNISDTVDGHGGSIEALTRSVDSDKATLPPAVADAMREAERIAQLIGVEDIWNRNSPQQIRDRVNRATQNTLRLEEDLEKLGLEVEAANARMAEYNRLLSNPDALNRGRSQRLSSLLRWSNPAREIRNYFRASKTAFETQSPVERAEMLDTAKVAQAALGSAFVQVIQAVNDRIRERSPYCYVNRSVPVRLRVKQYDYLNERPIIDPEDYHPDESESGGGETSMTVLALASRSTETRFGHVLLVDEFGDAPTFKELLFEDLAQQPELGMALFVNVVKSGDLTLDVRG